MVARAVAPVQDGDTGGVLSVACRALTRMAHGDDVGVSIDHLDGVEERLSLHHGGRTDVAEVDDVATKPLHRRLKGHPRPGAWLEEQVPKDASGEQRHLCIAPSNRQQPLGRVQHFDDVFVGQVCHRDEPGHSTSSEPSVEVHP